MVAVAYRRWSFTRGFNFKALARKILVFWIGGRLWETIAYERWSHMEGSTVFWYRADYLYRYDTTSHSVWIQNKPAVKNDRWQLMSSFSKRRCSPIPHVLNEEKSGSDTRPLSLLGSFAGTDNIPWKFRRWRTTRCFVPNCNNSINKKGT